VIAFCSDVHGNLEALEAFISATVHCSARYCCGDMVGYGDRPNEVCELLRRLDMPCIAGNHDWMVIGRLDAPEAREGIYRTQWSRSVLSEENRRWLSELPEHMSVRVGVLQLLLRHASPWDMTTYLFEASREVSEAMPEDGSALVVGHTHRAFVQRGRNGTVVNCGSVGLPRSGPPGAQYAELSDSGEWAIRTAPYDTAALQSRLKELSWDSSVIERIGNPDRSVASPRFGQD
jgi:predicted phosphodiesterase